MQNPFFKNHGPILICEILEILEIENKDISSDYQIKDIKDL